MAKKCARTFSIVVEKGKKSETFPLLGFSVRSWMVGWKRSLAKQREEVVTGGDQVS